MRSSTTAVILACLLTLLSACAGDDDRAPVTPAASPTASGPEATPSPASGTPAPTARPPAPWQRTETREPCASFALLRQPFFGDLHVHTAVSADAYLYGTRVQPADAYAFARGESIPLADDDEAQTRTARIERPLDFTAVTDHAEFFGEVKLCSTAGSAIYDQELCQLLRQAEAPEDRFTARVEWLYPLGIDNPPLSLPICDTPGIDCDAAAVSVWKDMQAAAEEAYDRTAACRFTSFVGYEYTASPAGKHLHRNIIFRNEHVPATAAGFLATAAGGIPQGLWTAVENDCLHAGSGCDALVIPHNSNLSGGQQWLDPADAAEARRRQDLEPLVEIHQNKGNSECRFDRLAGRGVETNDELCTFEQLPSSDEFPGTPPPSIDDYPPRNMVRNTLKDGLRLEDQLGVNPFKLGFIGSTDTHNGNAGDTDEYNWDGVAGNIDSSPARQLTDDQIRNNPGGLAVVWAEENSRDALFAALRRRETYATSGTRPIVRFFGGSLADADCNAMDLVDRAYRGGTPMGGDLGDVRGAQSPRFAVIALKDPGTEEAPGTDLQRLQIVKGWVDAAGETHEQVFDVAGNPDNGAGVDPQTCATVGSGAAQLCAVWEDPQFDRAQRAFYYARVLENPTCRWSTRVCQQIGVNPFDTDCAAQAERAGAAYANCCISDANDPFHELVIQERAWTSPIWYRPDAIATVEGGIRYGNSPGADTLSLTVTLGRLPAVLSDPQAQLHASVNDGDEIYSTDIPVAAIDTDADGNAVAHIDSGPLDLSAAEPVDHMVAVTLSAGTYRAEYTRLWHFAGGELRAPE